MLEHWKLNVSSVNSGRHHPANQPCTQLAKTVFTGGAEQIF